MPVTVEHPSNDVASIASKDARIEQAVAAAAASLGLSTFDALPLEAPTPAADAALSANRPANPSPTPPSPKGARREPAKGAPNAGMRERSPEGADLRVSNAAPKPTGRSPDAVPRMPRVDCDLSAGKQISRQMETAADDVRVRPTPANAGNVDRKKRGRRENAAQPPRRRVRKSAPTQPFRALGAAILTWSMLVISSIWVLSGDTYLIRIVQDPVSVLSSTDLVSVVSVGTLSFIVVLLVVSLFVRADTGQIADELLRKAATAPLVAQSTSLRTEVGNLASKLENVIVRASDLELAVRKEITALEGAYSENEKRTMRLLTELEQQRNRIVQHVIDVKNEAKQLESIVHGNANAAATLLRATHEEVIGGLSEAALALREALKAASEDVAEVTRTSLGLLRSRIAEDISGIEASLSKSGSRASEDMAQVGSSYKAALEEQQLQFERGLKETFDASAGQLEAAAARLADIIRSGSNTAQQEFALAGRAFDAVVSKKVEHMDSVLKRVASDVDSILDGRIAQLNSTIDTQRSVITDLTNAAETVGRNRPKRGNVEKPLTSLLRPEGMLMSVVFEDEVRRADAAAQGLSCGLEVATDRALRTGRAGEERKSVGTTVRFPNGATTRPASESLRTKQDTKAADRVVPFPTPVADDVQYKRPARRTMGGGDSFDFVRNAELRRSLNEAKQAIDKILTRPSARLLWTDVVDAQQFETRLLTSYGQDVMNYLVHMALDRLMSAELFALSDEFINRISRYESDEELLAYLLCDEGRTFTVVSASIGALPSTVEEVLRA